VALEESVAELPDEDAPGLAGIPVSLSIDLRVKPLADPTTSLARTRRRPQSGPQPPARVRWHGRPTGAEQITRLRTRTDGG